jgi:hypothetical protein
MKQKLLFIKFGPANGRPLAPAIPVPLPEGEPDRVWTLFRETDENKPPALPIVPAHRVNAFMEDYMHDWNVDHKGNFRYASRVTDQPVWVLLEYRE